MPDRMQRIGECLLAAISMTAFLLLYWPWRLVTRGRRALAGC
jgi:hypothetical protein